MNLKRKLLLISFVTILLVAILHYYALKLSWYWAYRWSDIPIHILGGFWISLTALWASLEIGHIDRITGYKRKAMIVMLSCVILGGVVWEVFELVANITNVSFIGYWSDTLGDISSGFLGGLIAYSYFTKTKKGKPVECSKYHVVCALGNPA
ncbi:MAG: hypothetical protein WCX27_00445 [Candidatus Paceibacterota bacterium]